MNIEKSLPQPEQKDFRDEEVITGILESGVPEELEKLRAFYNLTSEEIKLGCDFAKLRKKTHEEMEQELNERIKQNPNPTEEELNMGTYKENIEPQVREIVLNLRRKGYNTYESGFYGFNAQKIGFNKDYLKDFQVPKELIEELKKKDISIKIEPNSISFISDNYLELDEMKKIWEKVENTIPDLGQSAEPNSPAAEIFRKRVEQRK